MAISQNIKFFGILPTSIVLQSLGDFSGANLPSADPVITPGQYLFAPEAGIGKYQFHEYPITVSAITYRGGGTLTVKKGFAGGTAIIATIATQGEYYEDIAVGAQEWLEFSTVGATNPVISIIANEMNQLASGLC